MWEIRVRKLHPDAQIPTRGSEEAACWDVYSLENVPTPLNEEVLRVRTGLSLEVPKGYFLDIRPRSGLSKYYRIANSPGTLDSDYRGELIILLEKRSPMEVHQVRKGDRVAQVRLEKVFEVEWLEVIDLTPTIRGEGGFGSTGD